MAINKATERMMGLLAEMVAVRIENFLRKTFLELRAGFRSLARIEKFTADAKSLATTA